VVVLVGTRKACKKLNYKKKAKGRKEKMKRESLRNKVESPKFDYEEEVNEFTGLIFHCPNCEEVFHLHIANVRIKKQGGKKQ